MACLEMFDFLPNVGLWVPYFLQKYDKKTQEQIPNHFKNIVYINLKTPGIILLKKWKGRVSEMVKVEDFAKDGIMKINIIFVK